MRRLFLPVLLGLSTSCAPPQAPRELEQLACFIFDHADDEDPELLIDALQNLDQWLSEGHQEDAEEGYQINLLIPSAVSDLEGDNHNLSDDLIGAAVATEYGNHEVERVVEATALEDWEAIMGDLYEYYRKEWLDGGACLGDRGCLTSEARAESELVTIGVSVASENRIEYRWLEMDTGWAFVHRSWLTEPPVVSSDLVDPNSQYYLAITIPGSQSLRLQATWIDTKIVGLSIPKSIVADTMRDQGDTLQEWMDAN